MLKREAMRALGLDVGSKTIGVAVSDPGGVIASASEVLARRGQVDDAQAIAQRVRDAEVSHVVVGMPLELDGRQGVRARAVQRFVDALRAALGELDSVEVATWDERFSTAAAERVLVEADVSRAKRKSKVDALAAQFILQGWLDARPGGAP